MSRIDSRIDSESHLVPAPAETIYRAFAVPGAMERWLPPRNMQGSMLHFDFREGGSYRMRLVYADSSQAQGKTAEDADEVEIDIVRLEEGRRIEQEIRFESEDPAFSGLMRMTWTFEPAAGGTVVTIRAEDVPEGIRPEDHAEGFRSSLQNLAEFVEQHTTTEN